MVKCEHVVCSQPDVGQLRDRDGPLIPVTGIWQFDLHPKLWEKELSKTRRRFKKGEEERENFFLPF